MSRLAWLIIALLTVWLGVGAIEPASSTPAPGPAYVYDATQNNSDAGLDARPLDLGSEASIAHSTGEVSTAPVVFVAADDGATAGKSMSQLDRTGSALKSDPLHRSASWVVDDSGAQQFMIRGGDGVQRQLYQLPGEVNGKPGVFGWIVDDSGADSVITHQRFINGGQVTGYPNQRP